MQFRNNGVSTVFIYYFYERINTSRLIDMVTYIFVFTEIYATVGKAVSLFQNPHVFRWQIAVCDYLPCFTASFREVGNKLFHIYRNLQNVGLRFGRRGDGNVQIPESEILNQRFVLLFVDGKIHIGICISEMIDKVGNKIGSDGWQDADTQTAVHAAAFISYHLSDSLGFVQGYSCLPYYFFSDGSRRNILPVPAEYFHIQLFFQFLNHGTQSRLSHTTSLGSQHKVTILVQRYYIFHLL